MSRQHYFQTSTYLSVDLAINSIDSPAKLATYLTNLQTTTLAISSHLRFPSASEGDADGEPVRTWRISEAYRSFYEFTFDYAKDNLESQSISQQQARNLLWIILAPCMSRGQDVVDYLDSGAWSGDISKQAWLSLLDVCASGNVTNPEPSLTESDVTPDFATGFRQWLASKSAPSDGENGVEAPAEAASSTA